MTHSQEQPLGMVPAACSRCLAETGLAQVNRGLCFARAGAFAILKAAACANRLERRYNEKCVKGVATVKAGCTSGAESVLCGRSVK